MIDREKVLQGLEWCIKKMEGQLVCDECPYDEDFNCLGCSVVLRQAIALLREQEPIEPIVERINELDSLYRCGGCGAYVLFRKQIRCHACGRKVKWNDP